ncbi:MAG: type II toxin-antitoxin system PemK/MazF family toxin [Alcanivorax sp.]
MALTFHPKPGTIVVCDYSTGFREPEMVKRRPAIVVSPRLRRRKGLCSVVPLSTTEPTHVMPYHYLLKLERPLPHPWGTDQMWVKGDMISTVSLTRLDLIRDKRIPGQPRRYIKVSVKADQFDAIKASILNGLGINTS